MSLNKNLSRVVLNLGLKFRFWIEFGIKFRIWGKDLGIGLRKRYWEGVKKW